MIRWREMPASRAWGAILASDSQHPARGGED